MDDIFGSIFSIIWMLIVFGFIRKAIGKSKNAGKSTGVKSTGKSASAYTTDRLKEVARKLEKLEISASENEEDSEEVSLEEVLRSTTSSRTPALRPIGAKSGQARPAHAALRETSALSETMSEDRQHDWLARQIRDERKHVVWNNFVDLGAAHDEACAAELNRLDHRKKHQSYVVDDGVSDN